VIIIERKRDVKFVYISKKRKVLLFSIEKEKMLSGKNLDEIAVKDLQIAREFMDELSKLPIKMPIWRYDKMVAKIALTWFKNDLSKEFKKILVELDDDSFEVREKATKKIKELVLKYPKVILLLLSSTKDTKLSVEQRSRLNSILEDEKYKRIIKYVEYVKKEGLYKDPEYLSRLRKGKSNQ
jgi:hypothetical protein